MADDDTTMSGSEKEKEEEPKQETTPVAEPEIKGMTLEEWEKHKAELRREFEEARGADKAERDAIKQQLEETNQILKEFREAQKQREEAKGDATTMVVPPQQLMHPQSEEHKPTEPTDAHDKEPGKRGFFRSMW